MSAGEIDPNRIESGLGIKIAKIEELVVKEEPDNRDSISPRSISSVVKCAMTGTGLMSMGMFEIDNPILEVGNYAGAALMYAESMLESYELYRHRLTPAIFYNSRTILNNMFIGLGIAEASLIITKNNLFLLLGTYFILKAGRTFYTTIRDREYLSKKKV